MRFRTTALAGMLAMVLGVGLITVASVTLIIDSAAQRQVQDELERTRRVVENQHAYRRRLYGAQTRLLVDEPRLRAVLATEEITPETVFGVARDLKRALRADLLVLVDSRGMVLADASDASAAGHDLSSKTLVRDALASGEGGSVWLSGGKAYQVQARRMDFGSTPLGLVVLGYLLDDRVAQSVFDQTATGMAVVVDGQVVASSTLEEGKHVDAATLSAALAPLLAGDGSPREVKIAGERYLVSWAPFPGKGGETSLRFVVLRSLDQALAPGRRVTRTLIFMILLSATLAGMIAAAISRLLSRPLDALVAWTGRVAKGDRALPPELERGPVELRELGYAMGRMVTELEESRQMLTVKDRLEKEMEIASHLQTAILPRELKVEGLELAARMVPATEVGGDYYDVLPVNSGAFIGIGDVTGHGLTAGLVMLMLQNATAALVRTNPNASPRDLVCQLNEVIYENVRKRLRRNEHATYSLLRYHLDGRMVYAGAHEELIVCRAATGRCERLPVQGTWVGAMKSVERFTQDASFQLQPGDVLVLYSDGLTEAMNAEGEQFGVERLCAEVERLQRSASEQICEGLLTAVKAWAPQQADDITVMALRYQGPIVARA